MHKKDLGTFGELLVSSVLIEAGKNVYLPAGDNTKADIIAENEDGSLIKIQVKTKNREKSTPHCTILYLRKAGPNEYNFKYNKSQVDYFAVVDIETKKIAWVKSDVLDNYGYLISLSHNNCGNSDTKYFDDFVGIPF